MEISRKQIEQLSKYISILDIKTYIRFKKIMLTTGLISISKI